MVCIAAVNPVRAGSGLNRPHVWQFGGKMSHGKGERKREKANPIDVEEGDRVGNEMSFCEIILFLPCLESAFAH